MAEDSLSDLDFDLEETPTEHPAVVEYLEREEKHKKWQEMIAEKNRLRQAIVSAQVRVRKAKKAFEKYQKEAAHIV